MSRGLERNVRCTGVSVIFECQACLRLSGNWRVAAAAAASKLYIARIQAVSETAGNRFCVVV